MNVVCSDPVATRRPRQRVAAALGLWLLVGAFAALIPQLSRAQETEPIGSVGHGGFFDSSGQQIPVTSSFVTSAQAWYRNRLLSDLSAAKKREFLAYEKRLLAGPSLTGQDLLVLQHQALEWLLANTTSSTLKLQTASKLRALRQELNWQLPAEGNLRVMDRRDVFTPSVEVQRRLDSQQLKIPQERPQGRAGGGVMPLSVTVNAGQAYINECVAAGVPIPPNINVMDPAGTSGWKVQGLIPQASQFIVGTPAQVRTYHKTTAPEGMCFALPRYSDGTMSTVALDGVICLGKQSSKVCFWDNQWTNPNTGIVETFPFPAATQIPIGVPAVSGGKYQAGGKEIEFGPGGICTDCHAGENPYIIHPDVNLATSGAALLWGDLSQPPQNLPMMGVNRYDPLVAATWPQNQLSQAGPTLPAACKGCHIKGSAGRFPHLSNNIPQYCNTILAQAITKTMPQGNPGGAVAAATAFKNMWCGAPPNAGSSDSGDPHITTTNNIHYDFQAAGEFTALRNSDTGFELQTRQSPVLTSFAPGVNPYTGLASCVSLNTAAAMRVDKRRLTFQQLGSGAERLQLRVDGALVNAASGYDLGGGNVIHKSAAAGEVDVRLADGTRVVVTPLFWTSQGYWYLDVQVFNTPAREGVMSPIMAPDWLPRAPNGASFGSQPASLADRHMLLYQKFADAWRVTAATSLFDYPAGATTADFTDRDWPTPSGGPCISTSVSGHAPTVKAPRPDLARQACRRIKDSDILANCLFDVTVMGDAVAARGHLRADQLKAAASK